MNVHRLRVTESCVLLTLVHHFAGHTPGIQGHRLNSECVYQLRTLYHMSQTAREIVSRGPLQVSIIQAKLISHQRPLRSAARMRIPCLRPSWSTTSEFAGRLKLLRGEMLTPDNIFGVSAALSLVPARAKPLRIKGE